MLRLTQQFWICCVSIGVDRILSMLVLFLMFLLIAACGAILMVHGVPIGIVGYLYFSLYAAVAVLMAGSAVYTTMLWCQRGRQKRANSGIDLPPIESAV